MPRSKWGGCGGRVSWERNDEGRLQRLDQQALQEDGDLLVYNIDSVNAGALARHATDQRIAPPPLIEGARSKDAFNFETLERNEMLDPILSFLGLQDIVGLRSVSTFLLNYIDRNYLLRLSLPLPPDMLENLRKRKVLALTSCCNLTWLPGINTFQPFNELNLTNLREVKLIGKNCDWRVTELSQVYHDSLQHLIKILSESAAMLRKLEILTDSTRRSLDTSKTIFKLVNLKELVLHGIYHFSNGEGTQPVQADTPNLVIQNALLNKNVSKLTLDRFEIVPDAPLIVKSDALKDLSVLRSKNTHLYLSLPSLTTLETDIDWWDNDGSLKNRMKKMVETGCTLLHTWNGVNVKEVAKEAGSDTWAEHLVLPGILTPTQNGSDSD